MVVESNRAVKSEGASSATHSAGEDFGNKSRTHSGIGFEAEYQDFYHQKKPSGDSVAGSPSLFDGEELLMSAMVGLNRKKLIRSLSSIVGKLDHYETEHVGERELELAKRVLNENLRRTLVVQHRCNALLAK